MGFRDSPRLPSYGWEVVYPPPKVLCEYSLRFLKDRPPPTGNSPVWGQLFAAAPGPKEPRRPAGDGKQATPPAGDLRGQVRAKRTLNPHVGV